MGAAMSHGFGGIRYSSRDHVIEYISNYTDIDMIVEYDDSDITQMFKPPEYIKLTFGNKKELMKISPCFLKAFKEAYKKDEILYIYD